MPNLYQWLNREKERYYTITVQKEKTNQILLNYYWGSCTSNRGGKKNLLVNTEDEMKKYITQMIKRRKSRGYDLITPNIME